MALSKKLRFDVFKRDGFTCQYCGRTPPTVILECDHINPRANGGSDAIDNLATACFDCNRGKSDGLLTASPLTLAEKTAMLAEKQEQIKAFNRLLKSQKVREEKQVREIEIIFQGVFSNRQFSPSFKSSVRKNFLPHLPASDIEYAMHLATTRRGDHPDGTIKYFCGVCWRMRRENGTHG